MEKTMLYAGIAEDFYNSACPNHTMNGYEKNVLMDMGSNKCIFVSGDVQPSDGEVLFRCKRAHGNTVVTLKTPYKEKKKTEANTSVASWNRYEGVVRNVKVCEDVYANLVYLPELIANQFIVTMKVDNLNDFLEVACDRINGHLDAYEILRNLEFQVLDDSPGLPYVSYTVKDARHDDQGNVLDFIEDYKAHEFTFSHYEEMKKGVCAVFTYKGAKTMYPDRTSDF